MRLPIIEPMVPPTAETAANCARRAGGKPTAANEDKMPEPTPNMPRTLPCRAVAWEARPESEAESDDA